MSAKGALTGKGLAVKADDDKKTTGRKRKHTDAEELPERTKYERGAKAKGAEQTRRILQPRTTRKAPTKKAPKNKNKTTLPAVKKAKTTHIATPPEKKAEKAASEEVSGGKDDNDAVTSSALEDKLPTVSVVSTVTLDTRVGAPQCSDDEESAATVVRRVGIEDYGILRVLGQGGMGKVCLARKKDTNQLCALKAVKRNDIVSRNLRKNIFEEQDILKHLSTERDDSDGQTPLHPFLAKMQYSFINDSYVFFALEFYPGGDLYDLLDQKEHFDAELTHFYAMELASALSYLHEQNIVHRDLKPANILLDREGHVILTDFGLSKRFYPAAPKDNVCCGTTRYICPEMFEGLEYTFSPDWWSLGITPFMKKLGKSSRELENRIRLGEVEIPKKLPKNTKDLIRKLLKRNPDARLSGANIKKHPYFSSVDWSKVLAKEYAPPYVPTVDDSLTDASRFLDTDRVLAQVKVIRRSRRSEYSSNNDYFGGFYHDAAHDGLSDTSGLI
ncbi:kinase-like protein [Cylindrobasidium torrendii FP15055 ss-10]|uniref:Kinase-like protein n=1 Tax=Cylindrobasidium torrendii FP15055 ss-10 TaxID=1314674 RepID=A0A0D7BDA1_9AGAR|nr:kinase-like protein [Cylindrobasidium torrendii FP15055 ss-10]